MKLGFRSMFPAMLAATAAATLATTATAAPQLEWTNKGEWRPKPTSPHVLTADKPSEGGITGATVMILYAPSEADDVGHRDAIKLAYETAFGGTAQVDYMNTTLTTPTVAQLVAYDCVYTWADFAYADKDTFGDNLATANGQGVDIILGAFCTFTQNNSLGGRIMDPGFCPVTSPTGGNHFFSSAYFYDGTTCIWSGHLAGSATGLSAYYRDELVLQGTGTTAGVVDGRFLDAEIAGAYRGSNPAGFGDVIYLNGVGGAPVDALSSGAWEDIVANACGCDPAGNPGSCVTYNGVLGLNPLDLACNGAPQASQVWSPTIAQTPVFDSIISSLIVFGTSPTSGGVLGGYEFLVNPVWTPFNCPGGACSLGPIPPAVAGNTYYAQGLRVELQGATPQLVLLNGVDVIVGP